MKLLSKHIDNSSSGKSEYKISDQPPPLKQVASSHVPLCGFEMILGSPSGSSITLVLFFAAIGMITVLSYIFSQMSYAKSSLHSPTSLQALFNARSGIYRALYYLVDSTGNDTFKTINTLDSAFGSSLFDDVSDTVPTMLPVEKPGLDGEPVIYDLFASDSLGNCEVVLEPVGGKCRLSSTGRFHSVERRITVMLGCPIPAIPDTVVIYHNSYKWLGNRPRGTVVASDEKIVINMTWYNNLIDRYLTDIDVADSILLDPPLIVQGNNDLKKIQHIVNGPLLIDGTHLPITWNDTGTIIIKGDVQLTGEVNIQGITFIASGEIKILDECKLDKVNVISSSRIFIGDESSFQGNALALHSITVYGKSTILRKSSLITGSTQILSTGSTTADSLKFSILLSEESTTDAICIAIGTPGSIKTDQATKITGILWAQHNVCHQGKMKGLIYAQRVVDCDDPLQMTNDPLQKTNKTPLVQDTLFNSVTGEIEPLKDISTYSLPFFIGKLSIVSWVEE